MSRFIPDSRAPFPLRAAIAAVVFALGACSEPTAPTARANRLPAPPASADAASRVCPSPGTGLPGALNMLSDPTMGAVPMTHDAAQGNAGMFTAVGKSGC